MATEREAELGGPSPENLGRLLEGFRPRLERMLAVRLDPRVRRRLDPGDVLQEVFLEVTRRLDDYLSRKPMPFFLWVRLQAGQKLAEIHRRHFGSLRRDARREVTPGIPSASSASLAGLFVEPSPGPWKASARIEALERVQRALEGMDETDREVLTLRYFEQLSTEEAAAELGLSASGAKKRLVRALRRLRQALPEAGDVPTP